jgi:hypothetical protein
VYLLSVSCLAGVTVRACGCCGWVTTGSGRGVGGGGVYAGAGYAVCEASGAFGGAVYFLSACGVTVTLGAGCC